MSNITVFGNGYVGGSYADYFEENGYNVTRVDPAYGLYPTEECYNQAPFQSPLTGFGSNVAEIL